MENSLVNTNMAINIARIEVAPSPDHKGYSVVTPIWIGVDRPDVGGWVVKTSLVERLKRAIWSGAAMRSAHIATDVNGKTYWSAYWLVFAKYMNADLKRIGY